MRPGRSARTLVGLLAFVAQGVVSPAGAVPQAAAVSSADVPSPASVLGFEPGTERRLAD